MLTLDIDEAANLLHMSIEGLRRKAKTGEIPAAKPGKKWIFIAEDLKEYIRSQYQEKTSLSIISTNTKRGKLCHFTNAKGPTPGGSISRRRMDKEYANRLELK